LSKMKPRRLLLLLPLLCGMLTQTQAQNTYDVIPLPRDAGGPYHATAKHLASNGWIAGTRTKPKAPTHAFMWKEGKTVALLPALGGKCSTGNGVNKWMHEVGSACLAGDTVQHAAMWRKGGVIDLDTFGGVGSEAVSVNSTDHVVGNYTLNDGTIRGFFWKGTATAIPGLGGSATFPRDISESGVVTGASDVSDVPDPVFGIPPYHGFQWMDGVMTDFGKIFGSDFNFGNSVDSKGRIVGAADLAGDQAADAIVWNQGSVHRLPHAPSGEPVNWALATNNVGVIVGAVGFLDDPMYGPPTSDMACPCTAVMWQHGKLSYLFGPPGWEIYVAKAINDAGEILAVTNHNDHFQDVLLKPVKSDLFRYSIRSVTPKPHRGPRRIQRDLHGRILIAK
jgi:uncharacterized membrane protein